MVPFIFLFHGKGGLSGDELIVSCVQGVADLVQLLLILIGVREPLFSSNFNQSKDKLHLFESPPEHLLFCHFLNGDALRVVLLGGRMKSGSIGSTLIWFVDFGFSKYCKFHKGYISTLCGPVESRLSVFCVATLVKCVGEGIMQFAAG